MPQLRQNIITGDWVVIAPERAKRPNDYIVPEMKKKNNQDSCPFCVDSKENKKNERVPRASTKNIYVIENKFPAFVEKKSKAEVRSFYPENAFYRARPSIGDHEVIIVKDHNLSLVKFSKSLMAEMFEVIQERYLAMKKEKGVVSIMPIYNHGAEAGASIEHPHAQIFASGIVANTVGRELDGAERYFGINGICVFCDIIKHELKEKVRLVCQNEDFVAATQFASRFPMETWIYPKKHQSQFEEEPKSKLESLADCLVEVVRKMEKNVPNIPLNFYIHSLPKTLDGSSSYHWHLEITPRITNYGGYELGSGVVVDVMSPEIAAEFLRKV